MRILLLVSAFDGLAQRAWCALRAAGHDVGVLIQPTASPSATAAVVDGVRAAQPELIIGTNLTDPVPAEVCRAWPAVVLQHGPAGDRGPDPLGRAIIAGVPVWGVTAVQAVAEPGAGPVWASRTFPMPATPPRKSSLYHGPVADAAMQCLAEVVAKAADPAFWPAPAPVVPAASAGAAPPEHLIDWAGTTEQIVRRVRAADGRPGVRALVAGLAVQAYDAHAGLARGARPGEIISRRQGAVLIGTGDGSVWLGQLRSGGVKLPATTLLGRRLRGVPHSVLPAASEAESPGAYRQVRYRRSGAVGWLAFDFYNGAMSAGHCRRLLAGFRYAAAQDTTVLVLRGGTDTFSNGIHLTVIDAADDPAASAWATIKALNAVCKEIITCTRQVVIAAYAGRAAGGGAMLGLGADLVAARDQIVLNPYYDIGLYGSELHTYTLPRRVGPAAAQRLIDDKLPVTAAGAASLGLIDEVGPRHPDAYADWLTELAASYADPATARRRRAAKAKRLLGERLPLDVYEARELAETSRDVFADRSGFTAARQAAVHRSRPPNTPARLLLGVPAEEAPAPVPIVKNRAADTSPAVRPPVPLSA